MARQIKHNKKEDINDAVSFDILRCKKTMDFEFKHGECPESRKLY